MENQELKKQEPKKHAFHMIQKDFTKLVDETTFLKECSFAMQSFAKNKTLAECTDASKLTAVMNVAQTGLSLNPVTKYAYLVPRWNGKLQQNECHLEPSYQGLVKLVTDTGSAKNVYCYPVYDGDDFQEMLGTSIEIRHIPKRETEVIKLFYAVAVLHDGSKQVEVMTVKQIDEIRDKSESYKAFKSKKIKSCIWEDHYQEMGRKTVIKRMVKYLTKTDQSGKLATAIDLDNLDYKITPGQEEFIYTLMRISGLSEDQKQEIEREIDSGTVSADRATELIQHLQENQLDPINSGNMYSAKQIGEKLDDEAS